MNQIKFILIVFVFLTSTAGVTVSQSVKSDFETGKKAFYSDDFETANKKFSGILNMESDDYDVCYFKGLIYFIYFDYEKSIIELSKAINQEKNADAYFNRALSYEKQEKFNEALSDYSSALKLNKRFTDAYFNRAVLYQQIKQTDKAIKDYGRVIKLNPKDDIAYYNRGLLYAELGNKEKAIEDFEMAIKIDKIWKNELTKKINELKK